ncbi:hypothetical protein HY490_03415, partial [Candidatus Woesearchaeota archaeon]|nr:hypothetical protein [Candidatus Woesearchaeota archaeon]
MPTFVIEHLEPKVFQWCVLEYRHISQIVGKENLWFTNASLPASSSRLAKFGKVFQE